MVPETDGEPLDPPLEDHRSADVVLKMTISWMRWQTMWPRDGSETSSTSSAAVGQTQVGPLEDKGWWVAIEKFISVMVQQKREWTEVKELTPLKSMPYVARLFHEVTRRDLQGLDQFTRWIGLSGYYHWRVVQQGLIHQVPHLQDEPRPRTPKSHPSGRPLPARPSSTGTPGTGASAGPPIGVQPTPEGGGQRPASNQGGGQRPTSNQGGGQRPTSNQGGSASTPSQSRRPTASSRGGRSSAPRQSATPTTSGGPTDQPSGGRGAGDGNWTSWYQLAMRESGGRISEPQGPPFLIASAQVRWEAVSQIYGQVYGKEPPDSNITSRALRAYYTRVDLPTLHMWTCQALCMIAEYHMACVTRGSPVTNPILPGELEERLPPLTDYAPPEDHTGITDVRVQDNWARTLHVAVWCHRLDMAVSDPDSSKSLVRSCHQMGCLLAYFLGPGTAWKLQFEDVVAQVL